MKKKFNAMSYQELIAKRDELKKTYFELRFKSVVSHVDNPIEKRTLRRDIARLHTFIRQHDIANTGKVAK